MRAQTTLGGPRTGPGVGEQPWEKCLAPTCKKPCASFPLTGQMRSCPVSTPYASLESSVTASSSAAPYSLGKPRPQVPQGGSQPEALYSQRPRWGWACQLAALPTGPPATDRPFPCTNWPLPPHSPLIPPPPPTILLPRCSCNMPITLLPQGLCTCSLYLGCSPPITTFDTHFPAQRAVCVLVMLAPRRRLVDPITCYKRWVRGGECR